MKKTILVGIVSLFAIPTFSQSNTVAAGNNITGSGGSVSYTVGQIDYINSTGSNGTVSQGVQQPYEFYSLGIKENSLLVSIFPNPTTDILTLNFSSIDQLSYQLIDMNGKILLNKEIHSLKTHIQMNLYSAGVYHLSILKNDQTLESTKIIKH